MITINKGEPWIFWPSSICDTLPINPANRCINGNHNFSFEIWLELLEIPKSKGTIFAILPDYTGIDIDIEKLSMIFDYNGKREYTEIDNNFKINELIKIKFEHLIDKYINIYASETIIYQKNIENLFLGNGGSDSHIIFGAGNFPKNNFNLNYLKCNLHYFNFSINNEIISEHDFKKIIHGKSFDLTGNCNFIHKI